MLPMASQEHGWHPRGLLAFKLKNLVAQIDEKKDDVPGLARVTQRTLDVGLAQTAASQHGS